MRSVAFSKPIVDNPVRLFHLNSSAKQNLKQLACHTAAKLSIYHPYWLPESNRRIVATAIHDWVFDAETSKASRGKRTSTKLAEHTNSYVVFVERSNYRPVGPARADNANVQDYHALRWKATICCLRGSPVNTTSLSHNLR